MMCPRKRPVPVAGPDDVPGGSLGEKLEWLIRHRWPESASPPGSNVDIAASITEVTGEPLSSGGVWKLRTGQGENPTLKTLTMLAAFFSVPLGFFGNDQYAEILGEQAGLAALLRGKDMSSAELRTLADLSAAGRRMIKDMIASVARMERGTPDRPATA